MHSLRFPPRAWGAGAGPASSETPKPAVLYFAVTFPQSCCQVRHFALENIPPSFLRDHLRSLHTQRSPNFRSRIHNNVLPGSESGVLRVYPFLFFARKVDVVFYLQNLGLAGMCH